MKFELDKQTLEDLAIFQNPNGSSSIFSLFNKTITYGGADKLREIFDTPLTNPNEISKRVAAISYLQRNDTGFVCDKGSCDFIEYYLQQGNKPLSINWIRAFEKWLMYLVKGNPDFYVVHRGILYTLNLLQNLIKFTGNNKLEELPELLKDFHQTIQTILDHADFALIHQLNTQAKLGALNIARADHLLRYLGFARVKVLMDVVYQLDVLMTAADAGKSLNFSLPEILDSRDQKLSISGMFHPFLINPVPNDIDFDYEKNVCFITGANMAGKSTFLKSIGICIFLSQIGFPVPASCMRTSVFNGLITTINLADNLNNGSSHFYNEVLRVKHVAKKLNETQPIIVIFDELFRGTNVKDAYDASLAIINAFSKVRKSFFIISTHIVEVANELSAINNISFKYMETTFNADKPAYSYKLRDGITEERMGMWIVNNEGIVGMINNLVKE